MLKAPEGGAVITGTGGLRKVRHGDAKRGKGKRGGLRVIYFWWVSRRQFWLFTLYDKDEMDDLSPKDRAALKAMLKQPLALAGLCEKIVAELKGVLGLQSNTSGLEQLLNNEHIKITYSHEGLDFGGALETAGGIARALPLLCHSLAEGANNGVFWVLAGDVFAPDFVVGQAAVDRFMRSDKLAHLWLVPNPAHNPRGDFGLALNAGETVGQALNLPQDAPQARYTYSTIGLYRRALFAPPLCDVPAGNPAGVKAPLAPLLRAAMDNGQISAELYTGRWTDVGTPERLAQLNQPTQ